MSTEDLEQEAMAKTYNSQTPDELQEKKEGHPEENQQDIIAKILERKQEHPFVGETRYEQDFSYLKVKDNQYQWHFIKFFDSKYGMMLSSDYILDYSSVKDNTETVGQLSFRFDKSYLLEYRKASLEEFYNQMRDLEVAYALLENFHTEREQIFFEYENDAIYLYQDGYIWRLTGYDRNHIVEYYQMYLFLMSLHTLEEGMYKDSNTLKYLYLVEKNALKYLYKEIDLRKKSVFYVLEQFKNFLDVVTFSLDNYRYYEILDLDYYLSKREKSYRPKEKKDITIHSNHGWFFEGSLQVGMLGNYKEGELLDFSEILNSKELSEPEKKTLLKQILEEKEQEAYEKKDYINSQFLLLFFRKTLEDNMIRKERWIDFLKLELLPLEELSFPMIESWVKKKMENLHKIPVEHLEESEEWKEFLSYIDISAYRSKILPVYITITPLFMIVECSAFGKMKNYIVTENYELMEWI